MRASRFAALFAGLGAAAQAGAQALTWDEFLREARSNAGPALYFQEAGSGRAVVLVHGFGAHSYTWRHLTGPLARRFRVIAVDLKGSGRSPAPKDRAYSIYDHAAAIVRFIRRRGLEDVVLVGHSFGGGVALAAALYLQEHEPRRLGALVLIDSIAYRQRLPFFIAVLRIPVLPRLLGPFVPSRWLARHVLKRAYLVDAQIPEASIRAYAAPLRSRGRRRALIATARYMIPRDLETLARRYGRIRVPTLILWCTRDDLVPIVIGQRLHAAIPNSQWRAISGCGHMPHEERPEEALAVLEDFLAGLSAGPSGAARTRR